MIPEREVDRIAAGISSDEKKQKWLKRVIREVSGATWILPDETLRVVRRPQLWGMLRRRRNQSEWMLYMLRQAAGLDPAPVDKDPLG